MNWHVYIILCSDDSFYTGITTQVERRFIQHATGRGAKYFRGRQPRRLVFLESGHTRSSAGKREAEIKGMTRAAKVALISSGKVCACANGSRLNLDQARTNTETNGNRGEISNR